MTGKITNPSASSASMLQNFTQLVKDVQTEKTDTAELHILMNEKEPRYPWQSKKLADEVNKYLTDFDQDQASVDKDQSHFGTAKKQSEAFNAAYEIVYGQQNIDPSGPQPWTSQIDQNTRDLESTYKSYASADATFQSATDT